MTDEELTEDMRKAARELHQQSNDPSLTERELRITMRVTVQLILNWISEIPAGD